MHVCFQDLRHVDHIMASFENRIVGLPLLARINKVDCPQIAVTGAASGMGLATAQLLASRGAHISMADVNESGLEAASSTLLGHDQGRHMYTVVDVRKSESVDGWIKSTVRRFGKLDGAVNMAGVITKATPTSEESDDHWDFVMGVNATGVFKCLRAELKAMKGGRGSIVSR